MTGDAEIMTGDPAGLFFYRGGSRRGTWPGCNVWGSDLFLIVSCSEIVTRKRV